MQIAFKENFMPFVLRKVCFGFENASNIQY